MLDQKIANDIIFEALSQGADFCDVFVDRNIIETISVNSSKVKDIRSGVDFGIGVRLIYGDKALYGYTNSKNREELLAMTKKLANQYKNEKNNISPIAFKAKSFPEIKALPNLDIKLDEKINDLLSLDKKVRAQNEFISQVNINLSLRSQEVEIFDSEGMHVKDSRPYVRLATSAIAAESGEQAFGSWSPGARGGYSFVKEQNFDWIADYTAKQALTVLRA